MSVVAEELTLTPEAYLQDELHREIKHEYEDGVIYAMAGASEAHNTICLALASQLYAHLRGSPCRAFMADMKIAVQTLKKQRFYYPDIQVTCAQTDNDNYVKKHPKLIIEVLSNSTERKDRAEKFYAYRTLDSLEEYVLVAQDELRIEIYRRRTNWNLEIYGQDDECHFESVDLTMSVAAVYEQVVLEQ